MEGKIKKHKYKVSRDVVSTLMEEHGDNVPSLCSGAGISTSLMNAFLREERELGAGTVLAIASYYQVPIDTFYPEFVKELSDKRKKRKER